MIFSSSTFFFPPPVDATCLRLRDAFCLTLADDVPLELGKRAHQLQLYAHLLSEMTRVQKKGARSKYAFSPVSGRR